MKNIKQTILNNMTPKIVYSDSEIAYKEWMLPIFNSAPIKELIGTFTLERCKSWIEITDSLYKEMSEGRIPANRINPLGIMLKYTVGIGIAIGSDGETGKPCESCTDKPYEFWLTKIRNLKPLVLDRIKILESVPVVPEPKVRKKRKE